MTDKINLTGRELEALETLKAIRENLQEHHPTAMVEIKMIVKDKKTGEVISIGV